MAICKTEAITIKRVDYSETSQIVTFLTRDYGKVQAIAKGAKRPKNNFQGRLDLLTHNEIVFFRKARTSLHTLSECEIKDTFPALRADLDRLYAASYAAELVGYLTPDEEEGGSEIFGLLRRLLEVLAEGKDWKLYLSAFEIRLLRLLGFLPEVAHCVSCEAAWGRGDPVFFSSLAGGTLCRQCAQTARASFPVPPGALVVIQKIATGAIPRLDRLALSDDVLAAIRRVLKNYIVHTIEKEPQMLRYV